MIYLSITVDEDVSGEPCPSSYKEIDMKPCISKRLAHLNADRHYVAACHAPDEKQGCLFPGMLMHFAPLRQQRPSTGL